MSATLPAARRGSKSTARRKPGSPPPTNLAIWRVLARSEFNRDAAAIVAAGKELLARVDRFLEEHDADGLADALRAAGLGHCVNEYHEQTGANIYADVEGLQFVIELAFSCLGSEVLEPPPTAEELETSLRRKPR